MFTAQRRARSARAPRAIGAAALALALLTGACSSKPDRPQPSDQNSSSASGSESATNASAELPATFSGPGPYTVGVITLQMGEQQVDVWYPAADGAAKGKTKDAYDISDWLPPAFKAKVPPGTAPFVTDAYRDIAPSKDGPFPLALFAHGFGGYRDQSTRITTHLASWGFVVASPDFLSRGLASQFGEKPAKPLTDDQVLSDTIDLVHAQDKDSASKLDGLVKPGKVAVIGHSAGGFDAIHFANQPEVLTYVSLAAGSDTGKSTTKISDKPSLYMAGAKDNVVPADGVHDTYTKAPAPKRYVEIPNSGHLVFADICLIGAGQGGVLSIAASLGITVPPDLAVLATDGCEADRLPIATADTVTNHFIVAQLRWAFGVDKTPVGLQKTIGKQFKLVKFTYEQSN